MNYRIARAHVFCLFTSVTGMSNSMEQPSYEINKDEQEGLKITVKFDGFDQTEEVPVSWLEQSETLKAMLSSAQAQQDYLDGDYDIQDNPVVLFQPINPTNFKLIKPLLKNLANRAHATDDVKKYCLKYKLNHYQLHELAAVFVAADFLEISLITDIVPDLYVACSIKPELLSKKAITSTIQAADMLDMLLKDNLRDILITSHLQLISVTTFVNYECPVSCIAFSPNEKIVASGSFDTMINLWDCHTGRCIYRLTGHTQVVFSVCFSGDGTLLASGSCDGTIKTWDPETGIGKLTIAGHTNGVPSICFSTDGEQFVSVSDDRNIKIWSSKTGECVQIIANRVPPLSSVCFSPKEKIFASAGYNDAINIWDCETGQHIVKLAGHTNKSVYSVCFSPDGTLLASGYDDKAVRVWCRNTGACKRLLEGHTGVIFSVCFSSDGMLIASASSDYTIKLWATKTGICIKTLIGHIDWVRSACFSLDNRQLFSASSDTTIKLWNIGALQVAFEDLTLPQSYLLYALEHNYSELSDISTDAYLNTIFTSLAPEIQKQYDPESLCVNKDSVVNQRSTSIVTDTLAHVATAVLPATAYGLHALGQVKCSSQKDRILEK